MRTAERVVLRNPGRNRRKPSPKGQRTEIGDLPKPGRDEAIQRPTNTVRDTA